MFAGIALTLAVQGCSLSYENTKSARAPIEQLVLAQSLKRSLVDVPVPVPQGRSIAVEAIGLTSDQAFAGALIEKWLMHEGFQVPKDGKEEVVARVTLDAFGTQQDQTFFGIPPIAGGFIPISTPELALYKAARQQGVSRFSIDFLEKKNGQLIGSTSLREGDAYYNQYTILFAFSFRRTDLLPPPAD
jgi:hypothetical protein